MGSAVIGTLAVFLMVLSVPAALAAYTLGVDPSWFLLAGCLVGVTWFLYCWEEVYVPQPSPSLIITDLFLRLCLLCVCSLIARIGNAINRSGVRMQEYVASNPILE